VAPKGSKPVIRVNVKHKGVFVFCALNPRGEAFATLSQRADSEATIRFLTELREWVGKPLRLVWDGNGNHRSRRVMGEADKLGIELVRMPPYQPQLNPVEEVWRQLNQHLANRLFFTLEEVAEAIKEFFEKKNYKFNITIAKYFSE